MLISVARISLDRQRLAASTQHAADQFSEDIDRLAQQVWQWQAVQAEG